MTRRSLAEPGLVAAASPDSSAHRLVCIALVLTLLLTACLRARLLGVPLERDEGEYAYMGQLILQGVPPYGEAHNMKLPGVYYAYAGIMAVLGQTDVAIHLALLLINGISIVLVFLLGRRLLVPAAGLCAAIAFAVLSLSQAAYGFSANTEHFLVPFVLSAMLVLLPADVSTQRRWWRAPLAGLLLGIAFVIKQHAAAFILCGGVYQFVTGLQRKGLAFSANAPGSCAVELIIFIVAAILPFATVCLSMWAQGVFQTFWFWTFTYAQTYAVLNPLGHGAHLLTNQIMRQLAFAPLLWLFAVVGVSALFWDRAARRHAFFMSWFAVCSFLATCPGLVFREHYLQMLLPSAALFIGAAAAALGQLTVSAVTAADAQMVSRVTKDHGSQRVGSREKSGRPHSLSAFALASSLLSRFPAFASSLAALMLTVLAAALTLYVEQDYLFRYTPTEVVRSIYGANPFPEAVEIGAYLDRHAARDDRVAVIGSEPQIYFYSRRRAATGFIYTYPLFEKQPFAEAMQRDMIAQIEESRPRYLVVVNVPSSWVYHKGAPNLILEWVKRYSEEHYQLTGVADILTAGETCYRWDAEARDYRPRSPCNLLFFERKSGAGVPTSLSHRR